MEVDQIVFFCIYYVDNMKSIFIFHEKCDIIYCILKKEG